MPELKVNKGPLPDSASPERASPYPFAEMAMGDWLRVEGLTVAERVQNAAYAYGNKTKNGFRLSRRKDYECEDWFFLVRVK